MIKVIGYCANCYSDIVEGDPMDCFCGRLNLVKTRPTVYTPFTPATVDEQQDAEDQMEYERAIPPE